MAAVGTGGFGCIGSGVVRRLLAAGEIPVVYDFGDDPWRLRMIVGAERLRDVPFIKGDIADLDHLRPVRPPRRDPPPHRATPPRQSPPRTTACTRSPTRRRPASTGRSTGSPPSASGRSRCTARGATSASPPPRRWR